MTKVLLIGSGIIGKAITEMLGGCEDYQVTVADREPEALQGVDSARAKTQVLDVQDAQALREAMQDMDVVLSACPYFLSAPIAEAARDTRTHYFDLTEDVAATKGIMDIARDASTVFMPQCGLAPGFVSIVTADLARRFDSLRHVRMRVGALPMYPSNALKYNLTWNIDGLINEYCNPCEVIHDGTRREALPLEGYEQFSLDGARYEAFNTSGGLGTLCDTLDGKVESLSYKSIRYPGHCELARFLINELRFKNRRALLKELFIESIPSTSQDVVFIFVTVSGMRAGQLTQETFTKKVYHRHVGDKPMTAIQITTAASVCAVIDLQRSGKLRDRGFLRQEEVSLQDLLGNRFGGYYM